VIPKWITRELGGGQEALINRMTYSNGLLTKHPERKRGSTSAFKYPNVCTKCNNGWMSDLEERVQPIITPMIHGNATTLTESELKIVGCWASKTAVMIDAYFAPRAIPAPEGSHLLYGDREPPDTFHVRLGAYDAPARGIWMPWGRNVAHYTITAPSGTEFKTDLVLVPIAFKHLLVWTNVLVGRPDDGTFQGFGPADGLDFVQAWPTIGGVEWPPRRVIDMRTFLMMADTTKKPS
jgi:hypothetical protein